MGSLAALFVNPLFLAGAALVAAPILIHLINRRRFRDVNWAAMEFLLAADKKNRRRVRLESLLLLLLRCLAMILIAVLIARPRVWSDGGLSLLSQGEIERVVLLDDSASMRVRLGNGTLFDAAKSQLTRLVDELTRDGRLNRLTVMTTSRPDRPVIRAEAVRRETVDDLLDRIGKLTVGEGSADIAGGLIDLERQLRAETTQPTRVIYVVTDLKEVDWDAATAGELRPDDPHPLATVRRFDDLAAATFLVDAAGTGSDENVAGEMGNLSLVAVTAGRARVVGRVICFRCDVGKLRPGGTPRGNGRNDHRRNDSAPQNPLKSSRRDGGRWCDSNQPSPDGTMRGRSHRA